MSNLLKHTEQEPLLYLLHDCFGSHEESINELFLLKNNEYQRIFNPQWGTIIVSCWTSQLWHKS